MKPDRRILTRAELRRQAAVDMHKLIGRLAEDLDFIVGQLGADAATATIGQLLAEGAAPKTKQACAPEPMR